jgi:hypothetical protein
VPALRKKRDNAYYMDRIKRDRPALFADYVAGLYSSVAALRRAANMISARTPLHELKNAWSKATAKERGIFIEWLRVSVAGGPTTPARQPVAVDGVLQQWAIDSIRHVMSRRRMKMGALLDELGFKRLNPSLGNALHGKTRIQATMVLALAKWLAAQRGIS